MFKLTSIPNKKVLITHTGWSNQVKYGTVTIAPIIT